MPLRDLLPGGTMSEPEPGFKIVIYQNSQVFACFGFGTVFRPLPLSRAMRPARTGARRLPRMKPDADRIAGKSLLPGKLPKPGQDLILATTGSAAGRRQILR